MKNRTKGVITGTAAAALAGYVVGLLTAPKSGKQTRGEIKEVSQNSLAEAEKQLKKAHTDISSLITKVTTQTESMTDKTKKQADAALAVADKVKAKTAVAISSVRAGEAKDKDLKKAIKEAQKSIEHLKSYLKK